jgi:hypothetical protein
MHFFGLVDLSVLEAIELYATRGEAERVLQEVLTDEPQWASLLRIEPIDLGEFHPN